MKLNFNTCFTFLIIVFQLTSCQKEKIEEKPNIILVLADDLGYGDLSVYNPDKSAFKTPNLDSIAKSGIQFTDAHTSSSVCTPTRYGILTGRYNWRTRLKRSVVQGTSNALIDMQKSTLASVLKKQGYNTAYIGKWHLGWNWGRYDSVPKNSEPPNVLDSIDFSKPVTKTPNDLGFDYAFGHSGSLDMAPYVYVENGKATSLPNKITEGEKGYPFHRPGPIAEDFVVKEVTPNFFKRGIKYIEEKAKEEKPYFLYLPLPSPHTPIMPTEEFKGKSGVNDYADFVLMIDHYMGLLNNAVKESGKEDNTIIIFTSDNGCSGTANFKVLEEKGHFANYIYRGKKSDIYDGGHRVPFIVKWPKGIKAGQKASETICTTDFMATFAEITGYGLSDNEGEDSYSLVPLFNGQTFQENSFREATVHHSFDGQFAIRQGKWKLNLCQGSGGWSHPKYKEYNDTVPKYQLYDMEKDPSETTNLFEKHPDKVKELRNLLVKYIANGRSTKGTQQKNHTYKDNKESWPQIEYFMTDEELNSLNNK